MWKFFFKHYHVAISSNIKDINLRFLIYKTTSNQNRNENKNLDWINFSSNIKLFFKLSKYIKKKLKLKFLNSELSTLFSYDFFFRLYKLISEAAAESKDALRNFAQFKRKHLCQGLIFAKVAGPPDDSFCYLWSFSF